MLINFLHIGPQKTGSTAIQKSLLESTDYLLGKNIEYPKIGMTQYGHHELVWDIRDQKAAESYKDLAKINNSVLLSSENFCFFNKSHIDTLVGYLPVRQFKVCYYVRRLAPAWLSHWQQAIKTGSWQTFPEYMLSALELQDQPVRNVYSLRNFEEVIESYAGIFGPENITILDYEAIGSQTIIENFFTRFLQVEAPALHEPPTVINKSFDFRFNEFLRLANQRYFFTQGKSAGIGLRQFIVKQKKEIERDGVLDALDDFVLWQTIPLEKIYRSEAYKIIEERRSSIASRHGVFLPPLEFDEESEKTLTFSSQQIGTPEFVEMIVQDYIQNPS